MNNTKKNKSMTTADAEKDLIFADPCLLGVLLTDRTTGRNIIWATDDYAELGEQFSFSSTVTSEIIFENPSLIKPRSEKERERQALRSKAKAEVFTPSWVCNKQNNLIDNAWFGSVSNRFNKEIENGWESTYARKNPTDQRDRIKFPAKLGKTWEDYVLAPRLEVSCGEAPYLTSRYDSVTGKYIRPKNRIGLLDRKLRVITENTHGVAPNWLRWAKKALQSVYGFEWQGDSIFLARKNLLLAVVEYYQEVFHSIPKSKQLLEFAEIISWNIWQMDGIKFVIPNTCHIEEQTTDNLFGERLVQRCECPGCQRDDVFKHNGVYPYIMDWLEKKPIRFVDFMKGRNN